MADPTQQPNDELKEETPKVSETTSEPTDLDSGNSLKDKTQDNSVIKQLRKQIAELTREKKEREQAELDKSKSLEEKLIEREQKLKELEEQRLKDQTKYSLERDLLQANVNPEFLELMLDKGVNLDSESPVEELQQLYPSAFVKTDEKPKPIGKVGVSQTASPSSPKMTREEVEKKIDDPFTKITPELKELAREHKIPGF